MVPILPVTLATGYHARLVSRIVATVADIDEIARSLPEVTVTGVAGDPDARPVYQVKGKSFVFFRNPRPDAIDPVTRERYPDVVAIWTPSEDDKFGLVNDESTPFFTTKHFDGYNAVLIREAHLDRISRDELREVIIDAWLCRAPKRLAKAFLDAMP